MASLTWPRPRAPTPAAAPKDRVRSFDREMVGAVDLNHVAPSRIVAIDFQSMTVGILEVDAAGDAVIDRAHDRHLLGAQLAIGTLQVGPILRSEEHTSELQ